MSGEDCPYSLGAIIQNTHLKYKGCCMRKGYYCDNFVCSIVMNTAVLLTTYKTITIRTMETIFGTREEFSGADVYSEKIHQPVRGLPVPLG